MYSQFCYNAILGFLWGLAFLEWRVIKIGPDQKKIILPRHPKLYLNTGRCNGAMAFPRMWKFAFCKQRSPIRLSGARLIAELTVFPAPTFWQECKHSITVETGLLNSRPFTNSRFHFPVSFNSVHKYFNCCHTDWLPHRLTATQTDCHTDWVPHRLTATLTVWNCFEKIRAAVYELAV
jgi:hypothetical protein